MAIHREKMSRAGEAVKMGMSILHSESGVLGAKGSFIFEMKDARTGEILAYWEKPNVITRDAGILMASLFKGDAVNSAGLVMLAVGTGATGNILAPDAPQNTQRKLNSEIARKAFASKQYRNSNGVAVAIRTNIVDFTTTFGEGEAVGALNEMGLMSTASNNPAITNPINNGPSNYDPTIDVTGKDLMVNYLTFGCVSKPSTAIVTLTWRLTF